MAELCLKSGMVGFPRKSRDRHILLKSVILTLDAGREYTEPEIADRLAFWLVDIGRSIEFDHVSLGRELVDARYLEREADGSIYRVADLGTARDLFVPDVEAFHADLSVEITVDGAHHWRRAWLKSFARELL